MRIVGFLSLLIAVSIGWSICFAERVPKVDAKSRSKMESSLSSYLQKYSEGDGFDRYKIAFVDLNCDGVDEAVVYARASGTCGSGGCRTLILRWNGVSWATVTEITITKLPIRLLKTKSNGWNDIGVVVQGGGIIDPYEAILKFDGITYPDNPTIQPAIKAKGVPIGKIIIGNE